MSSEVLDSDTDIADIHDHFATKYPEKFAHAVQDGFTSEDKMISPSAPSSHDHSDSHEHNYDHLFGLGDDKDESEDNMSSEGMMSGEMAHETT